MSVTFSTEKIFPECAHQTSVNVKREFLAGIYVNFNLLRLTGTYCKFKRQLSTRRLDRRLNQLSPTYLIWVDP